jgi:excinuclease UvrABC nuclease subunit
MHPLRIPIKVFDEGGSISVSGAIPHIANWESATAHEVNKIPRGAGCYALFRKNQLIYIGESENLATRLGGHNVDFDKCRWIRLDGAQRLLVEKVLIWHYMPEKNKELKRHDYRMRMKEEVLNAQV